MDEIETSLIVSGRGKSISVMFDRPVSVKGKSIGIKSVSFVNEKIKVISYKVRVLDASTGVIHTLSLPRFRWLSTDQLMGAIYKAFNLLYETLMDSNYETNPENIPSRIQRPSFKPAIATPGIYYTAIFYGNSGLKIVPGSWSTNDDVFTLFRPEFSRSDNDKLAFVDHEIEYPNADDGSEGKPLHLMAEPVFLLCDTIRPTYFDKTKQQVLDVIKMSYFGQNSYYFSNSNIQFHEFSVDELKEINFYFQSLHGSLIEFDDLIVLHLEIRDDVYLRKDLPLNAAHLPV